MMHHLLQNLQCHDVIGLHLTGYVYLNPLNAQLNPIGHLLALLRDHYILHVSRISVNITNYLL